MCQICLLLFTVYNVSVFQLCFDDVNVTVLVVLYALCAAIMLCHKNVNKNKFVNCYHQMFLKLKMHQNLFSAGLRPGPRWGSLRRSPDWQTP